VPAALEPTVNNVLNTVGGVVKRQISIPVVSPPTQDTLTSMLTTAGLRQLHR
jgi:hypothetical protein